MTEDYPGRPGRHTTSPAAPIRHGWPTGIVSPGSGPFDRASQYVPEIAPQPAPAPADVWTFDRVLDVAKNVVVIITCLVLLYSLWRANAIASAVGDALGEIAKSWSELGQ